MARLQNCIIEGLFVLTVIVLLNTRTAKAGNCVNDDSCENNGTCPNTTAPCDCGSTGYSGDTCADACEADGDCGTNRTCNTGATPKTCTCADGYTGDQCADAPKCTEDAECLNGGTCNKTTSPYSCDCASEYSGDTCQSGSTMIHVSVMSLMMSLIVSALKP